MSGKLKMCAFAALMLVAIPAPVWAAGTTYAVLHSSEPALASDMGRIYLYRESSVFGITLHPTIKIDGQDTGGDSHAGDYFYIDRPAATYVISTSTEKKEQVGVTVVAGQSIYVKFTVSMGFLVGHVSPSVVDPQVAAGEIKDCDYRAPKSIAPAPATPAPATAAPATATPSAPATAPTTSGTASP